MKKFIHTAVTLTILLFILTSCSGEDSVSMVQQGYLGEYTDMTVQEILDGHYGMMYESITWDGGETDDGKEIVQVKYEDSIFETDDTVTIQFTVYDNNIFKVTAFVDPSEEIEKSSDLQAVFNYMYLEQFLAKHRSEADNMEFEYDLISRLDAISGSAVQYGASASYEGDRKLLHEFFEEEPLTISAAWLLDYAGLLDMSYYGFEPAVSEEDVINKVFDKAKSDIRSYYGNGVETLYHGADINNSYVEYDPETNAYLCILEITYSTNIFDFWGTSNSVYTVTAIVLNTGNELMITDYELE